jgi:alpha-tubulin suppressor-like RCC1 family protein
VLTAHSGVATAEVSATVLRFESVAVHESDTCGITSAGALYCWSWAPTKSRPKAVRPALTFAQISASNRHRCGRTVAGALYCWGLNGYGQLGTGGNEETRDALTAVPVGGGLVFTAVTAGAEHSCGLVADGTAYCWGNNMAGQLGIDTLTNRCQANSRNRCHNLPLEVATDVRFRSLTTQGLFTCGIALDDRAYCWGSDAAFQLGNTGANPDCDATDDLVPCSFAPIEVAGGHRWRSVVASTYHACGLTTGGEVYCWGNGYTTAQSRAPVRVSTPESFVSLSAGYGFTCGLGTSGRAYCWGSGYDSRPTVPSLPSQTFTALYPIASGYSLACGLTAQHNLYCWNGPQ